MITVELIRKKRSGQKLSYEELAHLVQGFSNGSVPDYQVAAWLMASFLKGLDGTETRDLTQLMRDSGEVLDWRSMSSELKKARFADKHSTGGVGDKVSLALAPLASLLGLKVPMMSGRGLGHTGGTVDKLESIPGFNMKPDRKTMIRCLEEIGVCMMAQSDNLCPADKKLYHLRDVTGTVESVPLITASIVSKKWAEGVDALVFDVKCGAAAFMEDLYEARKLGESLVRTASDAGIKALAVLSRMEEPLGSCVGNALEVREILWMLRDDYPSARHREIAKPLVDLTCELAADMAVLAGTRSSAHAAVAECRTHIREGRALEVFERMLGAQGAHADWEAKLARSEKLIPFRAPRAGRLKAIRARALGIAGLKVGIGRLRAEDAVDPATGFEIHVGPGQAVEEGEILATLHLHSTEQYDLIHKDLIQAFVITHDDLEIYDGPLVLERIRMEDLK